MFRRFLTLLLCALLVFGGTLQTNVVAAGTGADVWTDNWRNQIFADTLMPAGAATSVSLVTARNAIEPFQIIFRPSNSGATITGVSFSDLLSGQSTLVSSNLSYHFVDFVRTRSNSRYSDGWDDELNDNIWINISHPVRATSESNIEGFPEILSNDTQRFVNANTTQPVWVRVSVPDGTAPGVYTGTATLETTSGDFPVDIQLEVCDVTIPDSNSDEAFNIEMWSQLVGNFDTAIDVVCDAYGVTVGDSDWWGIMESFADIYRENRINVMMINQIELILQGSGTSVDESGNVTFDWTFFDEFIEFFIDKGNIKSFACSQLAKYKANPLGWTDEDYRNGWTECIVRGSDGKPKKELFLYTPGNQGTDDAKVLSYLEQYLTALSNHLEEKGWKDMWSHHIIDEAGKDQHIQLYPALHKLVEEKCPGIKIGDATNPSKIGVFRDAGKDFNMDTWIIIEDLYEKDITAMDTYRNPGDSLWLYTSCQPLANGYLNRAIDNYVWQMETLAWLCYLRGADGYLHWGFNQWNTWTTNYYQFPDYPSEEMWDNTKGDGSSVYPDKDNMSLRSSIRIEAVREASEQYSLLKILDSMDSQAAANLINSMIRSGKDYEKDINKIISINESLTRLTGGYLGVSYDGNGAVSGTVPTDAKLYTSGDEVTIPDNIGNLENNGLPFSGWSLSQDGSMPVYQAGDIINMPVGGAVLYAQWEGYSPQDDSYTVTYMNDANVHAVQTVASPATTVAALPAAPVKQDHFFTEWNTKNNGTGTVFSGSTEVTEDITVYAQWRYSGGSSNETSRSSSRTRGGSSTITNPVAANTPTDVSRNQADEATRKAAEAAKASGAETATVRIKNVANITLDALKAMTKSAGMPVKFHADSMSEDGKTVDVRITLDPAKSINDLNLTASTISAKAKSIKNFFEKHFANKVSVVSLGQQSSFGQPVEIAAKIDLTGMGATNLYFYSYDKATNTYKRIENPAYYVDKNGYLHFTTDLGGDIVIAGEQLAKK